MKRSSIFLIILLLAIVAAPLVFVGVVVKDAADIKEWIVSKISANDDAEHTYKMYISSPCSDSIPECYMNVTTYSGKIDTIEPVNFIDPIAGVQAVMRGDSIIVVLDNVNLFVGDGLFLTVELPKNTRLYIDNSVPTAQVRTHNVDLSAVRCNSRSNFSAYNSQIGAFMSVDTLSPKTLHLLNSNVGAVKINGDKATLCIDNSNIGAMLVSGTCDSIAFSFSNIGVCSWNEACASKADITDCVITSTVDEGIVTITMDDPEQVNKVVAEGHLKMEVKGGEDGVTITPSQMNVKNEDGDVVEITPDGMHVVEDDTEVHITPQGIVVVEDGKDVVKIDAGGVQVTE